MTSDSLSALIALEMECSKKSLSENQHGYAQMVYHHLQKRLNDIIEAEKLFNESWTWDDLATELVSKFGIPDLSELVRILEEKCPGVIADALPNIPADGELWKAERVLLANLETVDVQERTVTLTVSTALWENWQEDTRHHPPLTAPTAPKGDTT